MSIKIDWYSFSFEVPPMIGGDYSPQQAFGGLSVILSQEAFGKVEMQDWEPVGFGRAPYTEGWTVKGSHVTIWTNPLLNHATFEATGQGCDWLRSWAVLDEIVRDTAHRATRIDIAVDIQTDTTPEAFVAAGVTGRMQTRAHLKSASGETVYIGSQKSDRFARVYRYAPPHPRSDKLRIEHVYRKEHAKDMAARWTLAGAEACKSACFEGYKWGHATWSETGTVDPLRRRNVSDARSASGTIRWLIQQAAPAFQRLVAEGAIQDPEEFLREYFLRG